MRGGPRSRDVLHLLKVGLGSLPGRRVENLRKVRRGQGRRSGGCCVRAEPLARGTILPVRDRLQKSSELLRSACVLFRQPTLWARLATPFGPHVSLFWGYTGAARFSFSHMHSKDTKAYADTSTPSADHVFKDQNAFNKWLLALDLRRKTPFFCWHLTY